MKKVISRALGSAAGTLLLSAALIWRALAPPSPLQAAATDFVLRDMTLVNPGTGRVEHQTLTIRDGRVQLASNVDTTGKAAVAQPFDGMYVLPGLVDMHAHLPPGNPLKLTSYFLLLNLAHGVTSLRDVGDLDGTSLPAARTATHEGYPGPRVFACGPFVSAGKPKWANTRTLSHPDEADAVVAKLKAEGMRCIKAYDGLTQPMLEALRKAADKYGLQLLGHVPEALRYDQALVPDVQHLMGVAPPRPHSAGPHILREGWQEVSDARLEEIVRITMQHGIINTPTLVSNEQLLLLESYDRTPQDRAARSLPRLYRDVVWHPTTGIVTYRNMSAADFEQVRTVQAKKLKLVRLLHDAGAQLYLGTDTQQPFVVPGLSLQQEMLLFERAGIAPESIWRKATGAAGAALGLGQLGSIASGAPADLLVFRKDPTKELSALDSLEAVISQGRLYPKAAIDAKLAEYRAHYESFIFDRLSVLLARAALRKTTQSAAH